LRQRRRFRPGPAADTVRIASIVERPGTGRSAGTTFKNGARIAINEINAVGGTLGEQVEFTTEDRQTHPCTARV
jgi:branched-chain amino acid transport system substrate-binding protein